MSDVRFIVDLAILQRETFLSEQSWSNYETKGRGFFMFMGRSIQEGHSVYVTKDEIKDSFSSAYTKYRDTLPEDYKEGITNFLEALFKAIDSYDPTKSFIVLGDNVIKTFSFRVHTPEVAPVEAARLKKLLG